MIINGYPNQLNIRTSPDQNLSNVRPQDQSGTQSGESGSSLSGLSGGDTLAGKIVSRDGNEVQIALAGGEEIKARLDVSANLPVGSTVAFTVLNSDRSGLTLSPLMTNTDMSSPVSTALLRAGLNVDERNMNMVSSMMEQGMSIGKEEIARMSNMLSDISSVDISRAVLLTHLGIEPSADNMNQFEAYLNYEHQVSSAVNDIMEMVPDAINELIASGDTAGAIDMTRDMLDIFTSQGAMIPMDEGSLEATGMNTPLNQILDSQELSALNELLTENGIDPSFGEAMANGQVTLSDIMFVMDDIINSEASGRGLVINEEEAAQADADTALNTFEQTKTAETEDIPLPGKDPSATQSGSAGAVNGFQNPASGSVGLDFLNALKSDNASSSINNEALNSALDTANQINKQAHVKSVLDLITSKPLNKIMQNAVENQWKLTPEQVGEDKQVSDLYKRMTEQTTRLLNALNEHTKSDSQLAQNVSELNKNMNFMNELNNMFNYVQLPVKLSQSDAHGELYVYSNKKNMASKEGDISALLHLDMDHLGMTDVYVTMNSANHVNTHFYLPDEESLDLIAAHIDELNARIENRGYPSSCQVSKREEMANMMQEIIDDNKSKVPIALSNFDARA